MPRLLVYGAGAVGTFFGGLLARTGQDVRFVARGAQFAALHAHGISIRSRLLGDITISPVSVSSRAADVGVADVVLVCVKTHQTAEILDDLAAAVGEQTIIVTMQNGVESDELVAERFGGGRVVPAVVYVGATVETPGVVDHVAEGKITIGAGSGFDAERLAEIRGVLATGGFPVFISNDIRRDRWKKLIWNAGFNPASALTGRTPAELLAIQEARAALTGVMREVVLVARAMGVGLDDADVARHLTWTEQAPGVLTSMMVDRERGRTMETEALLGVVVRKGREHGVPTPCASTLYGLLTAVESA